VRNRRTPLRHRPLDTLRSKLAATPNQGDRAPARGEQPSFSEAMARQPVARLSHASVRIPPSRPAPEVAAAPRAEFVLDEDAGGWVRGYRKDAGVRVFARTRATPQATLDLHRLTRPVARRRLGAFITAQAARGVSSVLVVVGKGHHSRGGEGVLRAEIAVWLTTGTCAGLVLAFESAPEALGGSGAVLVVLSRR